MISRPTVFVIGAGASVEYGFPLGAGLVDSILKEMDGENSLLLRSLRCAGNDNEDIIRFRDRLRGSAANSIDTFLEKNGSKMVQIGKGAIAYTILRAESQSLRQKLLIEKPPEDNWLKHVWNAIRTGCDPGSLSSNRVCFVTFNYDRVLEKYFETVILNTFDLSEEETRELRFRALPIVHLHGQIPQAVAFGDFDDERVVGSLASLAAGIQVVHEGVPSGDERFLKAYEVIRAARLVCFLGFGYDAVNVTRLRISELASEATHIVGSVYRMGDAEILSARSRLGRDFSHSHAGERCEAFLRSRAELI